MNEQYDAELAALLLAFNREAVPYCRSISDMIAQEYARMLQNRAKGVDFSLPRIPRGLFEPDRNLIRATLDRIFDNYFRVK